MRLDTIVIGMDFSPWSITSATWVARSLAPRATLALVHAIEPPAHPSFLAAETFPTEALETDARAQAMERLREIARMLGPKVDRVEVRIERAADVVRQFAVDAGADLIVIGPHGNRDHRSLLLGTTADGLVRNASVPVLVGGRSQLRGRTRVLAALVEAPIASHVLAWADQLSQRLGGPLTPVYALEAVPYAHMAAVAAASPQDGFDAAEAELDVERRHRAMHWLEEYAQTHVESSTVEPIVGEGPAAEVILEYAGAEQAAVIVLGSHRATPGLPASLGRTVRHVLHEARCAVLVVTPP